LKLIKSGQPQTQSTRNAVWNYSVRKTGLLSKTENLEHKLEGIGQRERALANREKSLDNLTSPD